MGAENSLKGAEAVFTALLVIGLIGLLFLIIYGNLAGNLGFAPDATNYVNESSGGLNTTLAYTMDNGVSTTGFISVAVTEVRNASIGTGGGDIIAAANYTVDATVGTIISAGIFNWTEMNISYTTTHKGTSELNTDAVIGNLTGGATQFFTFANVWFILTAITILIGIVLGVIALVRRASGGGGMSGKKGRSEFTT